ncbi:MULTISPECIES: type VII secretion-associated protein [Rhodococcus]|uniref:type VII secretion-associated protein n=1 Tax=Rhodococcus TaxID=1827 RepID=UPI001E362FD6|nr:MULTISPECIES: type VII secretion-associated protein [Rhodococcus]UGQ42996.1 type VII secretion-associated protein [Rhodococcus aetherivorans]
MAAAAMSDVHALHLQVVPGRVYARRSDRTVTIPASAPGRVPTDDDAPLATLLGYVAATAGAPAGLDTVVVIHPTEWGERRREELHTAARQVARNAVLLTAAVAARRAAPVGDGERCAVAEVDGAGVTMAVLSAPDGGDVDRIARDPDLDEGLLDSPAGAERLDRLMRNVCGSVDPDVVLVTGIPGEPPGIPLCERIAERLGRGIRVIPVAASEVLAAVPEPPAVPSGDTEPLPQWLHTVPASRSTRPVRRIRWAVVAVVAVVAATAGWVWTAGQGADLPAVGAEVPVAGDSADESSATRQPMPRPPSVRHELGPVRLELPGDWRVRDPVPAGAERVELVPAGGRDRRIVLVHSLLREDMDLAGVGEVLARRADERSPVIRDLDPDTTFADRPVIAYVEAPDEFSLVRWFVVVESGMQVAVGCQFLVDEWAGIKNECEQAVHTVTVE